MSTTHMEVANGFFNALLAGEAAALERLFAPHAVFWQNFLGREIPRDEFLAGFARLAHTVDDLHFEDVRRTATGAGFVEQHTLCGRTQSGAALAVRGCFIAAVEDGRIVRLNEYLDSAQLAPLRAARSA